MSVSFKDVPRKRLIFTLGLVVFIIVIGAIGFRLLEDFQWLESVYMSAQTVTTVGYGDLAPKTEAGRLFAISLC